ncbi:MAG: hypothetical protein LBH01_02025 [Verrucomicrobiales bacterium]|jgi:hypothetical protein|nr:hypothetical protein [Verrucomicrobiales bacterium]
MNELKRALDALETVDNRSPVGELMTVKRINALQDAVKALARGDNLVLGKNFRFHRSGYLTQADYLWRRSPAKGGASETFHPFKILLRTKPDSTGIDPEYQWGIYWDSAILRGLVLTEYEQPIAGLLPNPNQVSAEEYRESPCWFDMVSNDLIFVEMDISKPANERQAGIKSWGHGDNWVGSLPPVELNDAGTAFKWIRLMIGYSIMGGGIDPDAEGNGGSRGVPIIYQSLHNNLMLGSLCYGGVTGTYFYPYDGRLYYFTENQTINTP